ncbi:hypothetical protein ACMD2_02289 [Ananas comosus]|uniref:Uncharacterized protein n=1 Tax=Ananas comosus TaxID=4615 RepID=A0A199V5L8_ANACO|nr:hypothetical protein ACMD2_02289 [Ananas comosus]
MALFFLSALANLRGDLLSRHALLLYAATWTAVVTGAVALAAFTPELAFVWAVSPSSPLSQACDGLGPMGLVGSVGLPLDGPPWEMVCVPAHLFDRSNVDIFIPPLFAVVVVTVAVCFTRAIGIWEEDEDEMST